MSLKYNLWQEWDPKAYLATYFSKIEAEEEETLAFLVQRLQNLDRKKKCSILEFGCGPTVAQAIPAVPYADEIYLSDYLESNLHEIKKWIEKDSAAFDWNIFTKRVLELEGIPSDKKNIQEREERLRQKIKTLVLCDAKFFPVFKSSIPLSFQVIISTFALDSATDSKQEWEKYMENLLRHLSVDGHLFLTALRKSSFYRVGKKLYPSAQLDREDILKVLVQNGFSRNTLDIKISEVPDAASLGYASIILVHAFHKML